MKENSPPFGAGPWVVVGMNAPAGFNLRHEEIPQELWVRCMDIDGNVSPMSLPLSKIKDLHSALGRVIEWCESKVEP